LAVPCPCPALKICIWSWMPLVQPGVKYPRELTDLDSMGGVALPPGWKAIEKAYGPNGKTAGQTYIRFEGGAKNYKGVGSVKKCYELTAVDEGSDAQTGTAKYEELKEKYKKDLEAQRGASGERKEAAIALFEEKFGKLEAAVIPKIPGWTYSTAYLENSGQTHVLYYSPDKVQFGTVKQVEGVFGLRMMDGEDITSLIENARQDFIKEHGSLNPGYNPLRRTSDGSTLQEAVAAGDMSKVADVEAQGAGRDKKRRRILDSDYVETDDGVVARGLEEVALKAAGAEDAASLAQLSAEIRGLLQKRGFQADKIEILAIGTRKAGHAFIDHFSGSVFYQLAHALDGKPCFQLVKKMSLPSSMLGCLGCYIHWDSSQNRWQLILGNLNQKKTLCIAINMDDTSSPAEVSKPWRWLSPHFYGQCFLTRTKDGDT